MILLCQDTFLMDWRKIYNLLIFSYVMDPKLRVVLTLVIGGGMIFGLWFFAKTISSLTGYSIGADRFDGFAKCLTEKGAVLYTSETGCETCTQQKALFKSSYQFLTVVDCGKESEKCSELGIKYGPVWDIDGRKYYGLKGVPSLADITECPV